MSLLGFDNIKLFKRAEIRPAGQNGGSQSNGSKAEPPLPPLKRILASHWTYLFLVVAVISLFHSYVPSRRIPVIHKGEIAASDVTAPFDLIVEDMEATKAKMAEVELEVMPVYSYDPNVQANTDDKVRELFKMGREWTRRNPEARYYDSLRTALIDRLGIELENQDIASLVRLKFAPEIEEALLRTADLIFARGVVLSKNLFVHGERTHGLLLIDLNGGERTIQAERMLDLKESEEILRADIDNLYLTERAKKLLVDLGSLVLTPNANYNKIETENRKQRARDSIGTVTFTVKKGRVIIRKGDEAGDDAVRIIGLFNQKLTGKSSFLPDFAGSFILYALLFLSLWLYLTMLYKHDLAENYFRMSGVLLVGNFVFYKIFLALSGLLAANLSMFPLSDPEIYYYAFPLQIGTLIFASIVPEAVAIIFAALNSVAAGYLLGGDLSVMVFAFLGGLASFYGVRLFRKKYRGAVLRTGFMFIPAVSVLFLLSHHLLVGGGRPTVFLTETAFVFIGGIAGGTLAFLFLPMVESAFGFITASKLVDLTNTDLPIFKQMSLEAPGTYHHSLVMATLAEKAADDLGLDARLARAGALYHDIGKLKMPEYFIENQDRTLDVHHDLKPSMSTLVIINHVKEGVDMARKLRLPRPLRDMIGQHHGTSLVRYFYNKAKQASELEHETVGEETYRYPGPSPRSKEAALVMLADSVEAASRSLKTPTKEALRKVITDIFNAIMQDGQLDGCDLSLRDLRTVALSFLTTLFAIYHPRLSYPGFSFESEPRHHAPDQTKLAEPKEQGE